MDDKILYTTKFTHHDLKFHKVWWKSDKRFGSQFGKTDRRTDRDRPADSYIPPNYVCGGYNEQHGGCLIRSRNCLPFASTRVHHRFLLGLSVLFIFLIFCVVSSCIIPSVFSNLYLWLTDDHLTLNGGEVCFHPSQTILFACYENKIFWT